MFWSRLSTAVRTALVLGALAVTAPALAADKASDFTLRDMDGAEVKLSRYAGSVVVLSFWATWCGPCKIEMPHMDAMYKAKKDQGLVVLSISSDDARTSSQVKPYIKKMGYGFTVLLDKDSTVTGTYNPQKTLPYTVIIDRAGNVAHVHSGYNPGDELEIQKIVDGLLAPAATTTAG